MTVKNFLELPLHGEIIHEGIGLCPHTTVFDDAEIDSPVKFVNYTILPPNCTFGMHMHENNNEFYVVLSGEGEYLQGDEKCAVKKGSIMMNSPYTAHGIVNTGSEDLALLVFEVEINT